ncbi:rho GTPase-activating protein 12-like isoform X3 [Planococcus citri]|uniref:rho GTPase-activating protein 12-like isoform X3 n=1 Tax=Planococcus citri TaxID=170843 RepID=UPI0031F75773
MEGFANSKRKGFVWLDDSASISNAERGEIVGGITESTNNKQFVAFCGGYTSKTFNFAEDIDDNYKKGSSFRDVSFDNGYFNRKLTIDETNSANSKYSRTFDFDADTSSYFLGIEKTTNTNRSGVLDDYDEIQPTIDTRRDVKFVTFNKYLSKTSKSGGTRSSNVDDIFDDGVSVPVRPPRRKRPSYGEDVRSLNDGDDEGDDGTITTSFMNNCHGREIEMDDEDDGNDGSGSDDTDDESLLSFDYVVEASLDNGVSTTWRNKFDNCNRSSSTITCTSEDSDSFTCSLSFKSDSTDVAEWHVKHAEGLRQFGAAGAGRNLLEDSDGSRFSLSVEEIRINLNSSEYRSVSESNMTESSCQYHSFSSDYSSVYTSSNENSDAVRSDLDIPKSAALFNSVERWILDIYFSAFAADEQEDDEFEDKWFYSIDDEGRVYYFEENSTESSWTLPVAGSSAFNEKTEDQSQSQPDHVYSNLPVITRSSITPNENTVTATDNSRNRAIKSKSMILMEPKNDDPPVSFSSQKWPQLNNGQMCILKEGTLNRTKITENAKRIRKNWTSSYVALTELSLLFFKDHKSFTAWKNSGGQPPEMCVELNGALIDRGDKVSSRKNVYMISTLLGLQVLIQNDSTQQVDLWLEAIQSVIKKLPFGSDSCSRLIRNPPVNVDDASLETESKKNSKVTRSKSVKAKNKDGSMEDLTVSSAERQTKIKAKLKKFFHRRPTMESLVKKGIWKDEPAFGCFLSQVAGNETPRVPLFVQRCINCIEKSEENMKTDGLYRASGNLSQVQKIRLQVDQNNLSVIEEEEDVHVLTGALKLFFRELKEPLIPYQLFQKAIKAAHNHNKKEKISQFREIVKALPQANYDTLKFLLQHLLRISEYQEFNRMHIPNIAIVFGPTLMWPEQESNNMALDLMQQNLVIECLLVEFDKIFR